MKRLWIMLLFLCVGVFSSQAQGTPITLVVPEFYEDQYKETIIPAFEAQNPDIDVHLVTTDNIGVSFDSSSEIEEYLDDVMEYAMSADVLPVDGQSLTPEATRSGYFLDLAPLIRSDSTLNPADFYDAAWKSFQWDGGHWALPTSIDTLLLTYDPAAFDAAGLSYPNASWTLDDLANAIRTLAEFDANGDLSSAGFLNLAAGIESLFISTLGRGVYDEGTMPNVPDFSGSDLEAVLQTWLDLQNDSMLGFPVGNEGDILNAPLMLTRSTFGSISFGRSDNEQTETEGALLPGGYGVALVDGYAVSSGTRYPDAAYRLAKYLTESPEVANLNFGGHPARLSLEGIESDTEFSFGNDVSTQMQAVIDEALQNAIPMSQLRFASYLNDAISRASDQNITIREALDAVQLDVLERLEAADARRDAAPIVVNPPPQLTELAPGEISINFGVGTNITPMLNEDAWEAFLTEFAALDPEIGRIILDSTMPLEVDEMAAQYDCFYLNTNSVPDADLTTILSLDPLLSSDASFNPSDLVTGVLNQVQRNEQTWALPIEIMPEALRYDPSMIQQAGAYIPDNWTVADFELALQALKSLTGDDAPFSSRGFGNSYLLNLMAAYGGVPFDYSVNPPQPNFTDPATVEAIRQVLDLARDGLISFNELSNLGGGAITFALGGEDNVPIYTETLNGLGFGGVSVRIMRSGDGDNDEMPQNADILIPYPRGTQYNAVAYDVAAAYISASTTHGEACYRLISALAQNPDLIQSMPANRTLMDDVSVTQGENAAQYYTNLDEILQDPSTQIFPSQGRFGAGSSLIDSLWLNRAFDRYVLNEGTDLERELEEAQTFTVAFQECAAALSPFDPLSSDTREYFQAYIDCAAQVDPTMASSLPG